MRSLTQAQELHDILFPLPVGCSLLVRASFPVTISHISIIVQALLDTCHSGTLLDLPHFHCNRVYVPWESKGTRRTLTIQNSNGLHPHVAFIQLADTTQCAARRRTLPNRHPPTSHFRRLTPLWIPRSRVIGRRVRQHESMME